MLTENSYLDEFIKKVINYRRSEKKECKDKKSFFSVPYVGPSSNNFHKILQNLDSKISMFFRQLQHW